MTVCGFVGKKVRFRGFKFPAGVNNVRFRGFGVNNRVKIGGFEVSGRPIEEPHCWKVILIQCHEF